MIKEILKFELGIWFRKPAIYIYLLCFFAIGLFSMLGTAGYFDGPIKEDGLLRMINAPYEISFVLQYFTKFLLFLLPAIIGINLYRDYKDNTHHILYSFPIAKKDYLIGKFATGLFLVMLVCLAIIAAMIFAEYLLGGDNPYIGEFRAIGYLHVLLLFLFPNMLIYGLFVFIIVAMTRNVYAGFVSIVILFLLQIIFENLFAGNDFLLALTDPLAQKAFMYETHSWSLEEQNKLALPFGGFILYSRLFWLGLMSIFAFIFYRKFSLSYESNFKLNLKLFKIGGRSVRQGKLRDVNVLPEISHSFIDHTRSVRYLSNEGFLYVVKSWMFAILQLMGLFSILLILRKISEEGNFTFLPVTRIMLSTPLFFYILTITLCTFIFSGMLVHRSRMTKMHYLLDATASPNWVFMTSTILAIVKMQVLMLSMLILGGVLIQLYNGFYDFEFGLYFFQVFVLSFIPLIIWAIISVFVHTVFRNIYLGLFVLVLGWLGKGELSRIGLESRIFNVNGFPDLVYTDLNGYGNQLGAYQLVGFYWGSFALLLLGLTWWFWSRGVAQSISGFLGILRKRFSLSLSIPLFAGLTMFVFYGFKIFNEEQSQKGNFEHKNPKELMEQVKTNFGQYEHSAQPKITDINLSLDIYPDDLAFKANGEYRLENKSRDTINTLLIKTGFDEISTYEILAANKLLRADSIMKLNAHQLLKPLLPGESLSLKFTIENKKNGIFSRNSGVINNGTFLRSDILPRIGYYYHEEMESPEDSLTRFKNYYTIDADQLHLKTRISTAADQIAIAPGSLNKEWSEEGRNYYEYETEKDIKFLFSFNSGKYQIVKVQFKDVALEVYHHAGHDYNTEDMISGLKAAIDYNEKYFEAYPMSSARIIEFPYTQESFSATLMANSIPSSEYLFVNNTKSKDAKINLPFYVQAHEMTHTWFGNYMTPARALGAKMLTESLTEYISLRIYKQEKGAAYGSQFLNIQRKRYLNGRSGKSQEESPLYLVKEAEDHIAYGKGAMAFNSLAHAIGEDSLNAVIKVFFDRYVNSKIIYPRSVDLIEHLYKSLDIKYHHLIEYYFERVQFHEIAIENTKLNANAEVELSFKAKKINASDTSLVFNANEKIEVGYYNQDGKLVKLSTHPMKAGLNRITEKVAEDISYVILDPNTLWIERDVDDNRGGL